MTVSAVRIDLPGIGRSIIPILCGIVSTAFACTAHPQDAHAPPHSAPYLYISAASTATAPDDPEIPLTDAESGRIETLSLEEYVIGVVASEMPASFHEEALCAQAVAARSYAMHRIASGHICTASDHCQSFTREDDLRRQWGASYDVYMEKIRRAADRTRGVIMTYAGEPIEALYHASSCGMTSDASHVYASEVSYLRSVFSPETADETARRFAWTGSDLYAILHKALPDAGITSPVTAGDIDILSHFSDGRVERARIGGSEISGVRLRKILHLSSAAFRIAQEGDNVVFTCLGYGHGIGMSQEGANILAEGGMLYPDILAHYYTGIALETLSDMGQGGTA